MKQIIAKNRAEAHRFCKGGRLGSQRLAYWKKGKRAFRFERILGEASPVWQADVGGLYWSATQTVAQKLGI
jgi:hypothetical protein